MSKKPSQWSEFHDLENRSVTNLDGSPITPEEERWALQDRMQVEFVFGRRKHPEVPLGMYLVINGKRVASRGKRYGQPAWIPMTDAISFDDPPIPAPGNSAWCPS